MSPPKSPEALYHAIPQALADENLNHRTITSGIELGAEEQADSGDLALITSDPPPIVVDPQIRWIHFVLGCSTSPSRQSRACILWLSLLNLLLTTSTFFHVSPGLFVAFVLFNGAAQAALGAYLQTSITAVASLFGPPAIQAMMSGQAAVAVAVSGVQVLSSSLFLWRATPEAIAANAIDGSAEQGSARMFFALSTLFLIISAVAHNILISKPAYKTLVASLERKSFREAGTTAEQESLTSVGRSHDFTSEKARILRVAKANITYEIAAAYVFIVTLAVFPPITTSVTPTNPSTHPLLFNVVHFLVFNIGDFLGRYICAIPALWIWSAKWLVSLSMARTLFIPIFLMCNIQRPSTDLPVTPIINSDFLFFLILFAFGLSNGYVSSMCMMSAPSLDHNPRLEGRKEDVDVAATVASFSIVAGLALGSIGSFAVRGAICGCNPFIA
ncbi:hypothetical protein H0H81_009927 [Sphagnurus paluster]|uniref:Uncharacterized protein n=1 Tax=Sphagnurus paluster TaxID=117069 RepID=A0A9P7GUF7_9AGAR|nr:hypothetical protein H0H81_009927 [Sphagnurus paluster]